ncbi:hypothetical protein TNCV_4706531 [Trichonephila clavipes]|nr:hypothetical protein TNCV_4706531 [Trichonephila clavipes]
MSKESRKNNTNPMPHILKEFRQASGTVVSIITIHKETYLLCFHVPDATYKPLITKSNPAELVQGTSIQR